MLVFFCGPSPTTTCLWSKNKNRPETLEKCNQLGWRFLRLVFPRTEHSCINKLQSVLIPYSVGGDQHVKGLHGTGHLSLAEEAARWPLDVKYMWEGKGGRVDEWPRSKQMCLVHIITLLYSLGDYFSMVVRI